MTVAQLINKLNDDIQGVKHAPIVIQPMTSSSSAATKPGGSHSGKSAAEQYAAEYNKEKHHATNEYKKGMSKELCRNSMMKEPSQNLIET